jgi:hypothetical protein
MGQLLILLVSHSLGKGLAASPRFAEASAQAQRLLRVRPAGAAAIQSITVGSGVITVSLTTSATMMTAVSSGEDSDPASRLRGIGGSGWRGDKAWRDAVRQVESGGTIESIGGKVPTKQEAVDLIRESRGNVERIDLVPHEPPNPHQYPHINYTTANGRKGTLRIQ